MHLCCVCNAENCGDSLLFLTGIRSLLHADEADFPPAIFLNLMNPRPDPSLFHPSAGDLGITLADFAAVEALEQAEALFKEAVSRSVAYIYDDKLGQIRPTSDGEAVRLHRQNHEDRTAAERILRSLPDDWAVAGARMLIRLWPRGNTTAPDSPFFPAELALELLRRPSMFREARAEVAERIVSMPGLGPSTRTQAKILGEQLRRPPMSRRQELALVVVSGIAA